MSNGKGYYAYVIGSGYSADGTKYPKFDLATGFRKEHVLAENVTGDSLDARVSWMMENLERELKRGDKNVDVFGFPRGSATVLEFLNRTGSILDCG